ncbi:MAG TPA: hypothetical protein VFY93_17885 [Planctomycetota bacterium]|nr:hypothetical protein [Planctomycetota bacterium]
MRGALLLPGLYAAVLLATGSRPAAARPEFARREGKACGYCHINPRGGGPRNQRGLEYARNDFRFPPTKGTAPGELRPAEQEAFARVTKLLDLDHVPAAVKDLRRLAKTGKKDDPARRVADARLHDLEVKGTEILGSARLLVRGSHADEGVELLLLVVTLYKDLDVGKEAADDARELRRDHAQKERIAREERESKARLQYLDALLLREDGHAEQAEKAFRAIIEGSEGTRAAKLAAAALEGKDAADVAEAEAAAAKAAGK